MAAEQQTQPQIASQPPQAQQVGSSGSSAFKSGCFGVLGAGTAGVIIIVGAVLALCACVLVMCFLCVRSLPGTDNTIFLPTSVTSTPYVPDEAEIKAISDWKPIYQQVKKDYLDAAISNSDTVINSYSNSIDLYQTRQIAQQAKNYFLSCIKPSEKLKPVPQYLTQNVAQLDRDFDDYCFNNEVLATDIISYSEADSTSEQYNLLDSIGQYRSYVSEGKLNLQLDMLSIEEKIK